MKVSWQQAALALVAFLLLSFAYISLVNRQLNNLKKSSFIRNNHSTNFVPNGFSVICLGSGGFENDLTSFLIGFGPKQTYLAFDAGSLLGGLAEVHDKGILKHITNGHNIDHKDRVGYILNELVKGVFIGHGHIDHISGLVTSSIYILPTKPKNVYGLSSTLVDLRSHIFNWRIWPNMSDGAIGVLKFVEMTSGVSILPTDSGLSVQAFPLQHGLDGMGEPYSSTAFLVRVLKSETQAQPAVLYFSDCSADSVQKLKLNLNVWKAVVPLVLGKKLKAIFIEATYPSSTPDKYLFGHLTPCYVLKELHVLSNLVKLEIGATSIANDILKGLKVFVSHMKPNLSRPDIREEIKTEFSLGKTIGNHDGTCREKNDFFDVEFIFPQRGEEYLLA